MTVKIVTDSTSDITASLAEELGITVVPLTVFFGHESFRDRIDITTDEFYRRLTQENIYPTTTQPAPGAFADAYQKLLKDNDEILAIVLSSKLSGTYKSAVNAVSIVEGKCRIEVIDSQLTAMSLGLTAISAAKMASKKGATLKEISQAIKLKLPRTNSIMAFDTLKFLAKGGRIGKAQGLLGSLLAVKPVLTLKEGEVTPLTRLRSMSAAADYLYNHVAAMPRVEALAVEHATTPHEADVLVARLGAIYPEENIYRSVVSPVLGTYMGPNVLSVSFIEDK
ncbi:MAG: DegV family protein [Dehalococcoidia bacterium]|nr:MAG: DegV family protein [Dehalococcoidia bacterium]